MRSDVEDSALVQAEAQARIMLMAACNYVMETSRLGYDNMTSSVHTEAFGWIDVRDGEAGPKDAAGTLLYTPGSRRWPDIGGAARCPMHVMHCPPFAVRLTTAYNPIPIDPTSPDFGMPYLQNPDPQPVRDNGWPSVDPAGFAAYATGDPAPRRSSLGLSWFRVYREKASRFVVTCGAGGSNAYRDWSDVVAAGATDEFEDRAGFERIVGEEYRSWYRIEWSAAVSSPDYHWLDNEVYWRGQPLDMYYMHPINYSQASTGRSPRSQLRAPNLGGTMRWIERLETPPAEW